MSVTGAGSPARRTDSSALRSRFIGLIFQLMVQSRLVALVNVGSRGPDRMATAQDSLSEGCATSATTSSPCRAPNIRALCISRAASPTTIGFSMPVSECVMMMMRGTGRPRERRLRAAFNASASTAVESLPPE